MHLEPNLTSLHWPLNHIWRTFSLSHISLKTEQKSIYQKRLMMALPEGISSPLTLEHLTSAPLTADLSTSPCVSSSSVLGCYLNNNCQNLSGDSVVSPPNRGLSLWRQRQMPDIDCEPWAPRMQPDTLHVEGPQPTQGGFTSSQHIHTFIFNILFSLNRMMPLLRGLFTSFH